MTEKKVEFKNESIILPGPGIVLQEEVDKWGFLYDPVKDLSFGLNQVSIFVWKELQHKISFKEIIDKVREYFSNVPVEIESDITLLLTSFFDQGLISVETPSQGGNNE
ncbi:MAG: PqqD family peptide modification chaperone [Candidatus Omnitrophota bacterium]